MIVEFNHSNLIFGITFIMFGGAGVMISWVAITLCVTCKRPREIDEERNIQNVGQHRQEETKEFQVHIPSNKPVTSGYYNIQDKSYGRQDHPDHLSEVKNEQVGSKCRAKSDGLSKDCSFEQSNKSLVPVNKSEIESQKVTIKNEQVENKCTSKSNSGEGTKQVGQGQSQGFKSKDGMVSSIDLLKQGCQTQLLDGPELELHDKKSKNEEQREPKKQQAKGNKRKMKRNKNRNQVGLKKDSSVVPHFTNQSLHCESQLEMKPVKDLFDVECMKNQEQGENTEEVSQHKRKNKEEEEGSHKKKKRDTSPPRLENLGNTCYFNSALQALYQTHILGHLLRKFKKHCSEKFSVEGCPLLQSMLNFYFGNRRNPQEILTNVRQSSNRFLGYKQEDSHELIRHLCQGLIKEEKKMSQDSPTVIDEVFRGHVLRLYYCLNCYQVNHLVEQFYDLSLPISFPLDDLTDNINDDLDWMSKSKSPLVPLLTREIPERRGRPESDRAGRTRSVEACLKYYTRRDTISYFCQCFEGNPESDDLPIACDRSLLIDLPPVLVIHLQRFEQSQYGRFVKCGVPVIYPKVLDLAPYTVQYDESGNTENLYDLYGVVEHSGTMDFGHYIACIKTRKDTTERLEDFIKSRDFNKDDVTQDWIINEIKKFGKGTNTTTLTKELQEKDNQWYYASDSYKKKINEEEALGREAILLFYEKL